MLSFTYLHNSYNLNINYDNTVTNFNYSFLPTEILLKIFNYLSIDDILTCTLVSKRWKSVLEDPCFWESKLIKESKSWSCIISRNKYKLCDYIHPKSKYQKFKYLNTITSVDIIKSDLMTQIKCLFSSYFQNHYPNILIIGTGLDHLNTGHLFEKMFQNNCQHFEPIGPCIVSYGSGVTMKVCIGTNLMYKFNIFMIYSCRPRSSCIENQNQLERLNKSHLFDINNEDNSIKVKINHDLEIKLLNTNGLIYTIDAKVLNDYKILAKEFNALISTLLPGIPIIILLIQNYQNQLSESLYNLTNIFHLYHLNRPWCIIRTDIDELIKLKFGIIWLLQNGIGN